MIQKALVESKERWQLPALSIISSGSAALALQSHLRLFGLPDLRVVYDADRMNHHIVERLKGIGCHLFPADLDLEILTDDDVRRVTENPSGIDVTSRDPLDPHRLRFYDWLAMEVFQELPRHIFIPFGTGDLYISIISAIVAERRRKTPDPRLMGRSVKFDGINVYGATTPTTRTSTTRTCMDKLYAPFRPNYAAIKEYVAAQIKQGSLGKNSKIYDDVTEEEAKWAYTTALENNITTEPSGIAGLALLKRRLEYIPEGETILVINTGRFYCPPIVT